MFDLSKPIVIGSDHAGFDYKVAIVKWLTEKGYQVIDKGVDANKSVDYPDYARKVGEAVARGDYEQGVLVCGSGTGMAIAANKVPGIRAAVAWNEEIARLAREHNDANVLSLAARFTPDDQIDKIVRAWFGAHFDGGRHQRRVDKIQEIEKEESASAK